MFWKALILLGLAICVLGDLHATSEQKVLVHNKKISHDDHHGHDEHNGHHDPHGHDEHHGHVEYHGYHGHDEHHGHDEYHGHDEQHEIHKYGMNYGHDEYGPHDKYYSYPSYEFAYKVDDPYTGDKKGQEETRDGDEVKGEYWLMQPDGRKRIVKYHADKKSGFKAIVEYIGVAKHDKVHKSHHIPHYPKVEHKSIKIEHIHDKGGYKMEDHAGEHMKEHDKPFLDFFDHMPHKHIDDIKH